MPSGVYKKTKEHLAKIKKTGFQKGHPTFISKETYIKIGEATSKRQRGKKPPKGAGFKKGHGRFRSDESYKNASEKISKSLLGKPQFHQRGEKNNMWKGGITPINTAIRQSLEMKNWRRKVFERDSFICQICFEVGGKLNADHIKPFSLFPELRFELSNGRTLCLECHKKTDTYLQKAKKSRLYSIY